MAQLFASDFSCFFLSPSKISLTTFSLTLECLLCYLCAQVAYWGECSALAALVAAHPQGLHYDIETRDVDATQTPRDIAIGRGHTAFCDDLSVYFPPVADGTSSGISNGVTVSKGGGDAAQGAVSSSSNSSDTGAKVSSTVQSQGELYVAQTSAVSGHVLWSRRWFWEELMLFGVDGQFELCPQSAPWNTLQPDQLHDEVVNLELGRLLRREKGL